MILTFKWMDGRVPHSLMKYPTANLTLSSQLRPLWY